MGKYHVNNDTGVSGKCRATLRCPFGLPLEEHYATESEAQSAYEKKMKSHEINSYQRFTVLQLRKLSSEILKKTELKELNASQLSQTLQNEAHEAGMNRETVSSAIDLASILHSHQTRGNRGNFDKTPYIEHPLRNSVRLLRLGVKDEDIIVSAILHDTIEDGAQIFVKKFSETPVVSGELAARAELGSYIEKSYGSRVLEIVEAVSNDYIADTVKSRMSAEEKNRIYLEHVKKSIKDRPDVFLVKLSDLVDNAVGLHNNDTPNRREKTRKQAVKYLPVIHLFDEELSKHNMGLSDDVVKKLKQKMDMAVIRLNRIIARPQ